MRTRISLSLATLVALTWDLAAYAEMPSPAELASVKNWVRSVLRAGQPRVPFGFLYNGRPSGALLKTWMFQSKARKLDAQRFEHALVWTDSATGLQVRCVAVEYACFPVLEWTVYLKNTGTAPTPILKDIQGLDARFERPEEGEFVLHGIQGDSCTEKSYRPYELTLGPGFGKVFAPPAFSGKPCDGADGWPYFNLQQPGSGVIFAVGWPGQWAASFTRDSPRSLHVRAGQERTCLSLNPGEEIRTPLIAMLFWNGTDVVRAQNLWRTWYLECNLPRVGGKPQPPVSSIQVGGSLKNWAGVKIYLDAGIKPDICWKDAGGAKPWYPISKLADHHDDDAWLNTGTWVPDTCQFLQGFRPFSDKVRECDMRFLLWFEPERVGDRGSWLATNHPEWLLPGNTDGCVLNEGNPKALKWLTDHVDGLVKTQGLDWYREDLNGSGYGTAWMRHDAADRQGITENFHVQGHLWYWDELRRRNPALRIDSCASGGRRNDLETMRRAVPLLRSDFQQRGMKKVDEGNQGHTFGLSSWLPWYGSGVYCIEPYAVRSFLMPGFGVVPPAEWEKVDSTRAKVKKAYDEWGKVAHLMLGDYYPLTCYSIDNDRWIAWEFYRNDCCAGVVQAFRRRDAKDETLMVKLRGLEADARYEVENLDGGAKTFTGRELMAGFVITLKSPPAAAVFTLKKTTH